MLKCSCYINTSMVGPELISTFKQHPIYKALFSQSDTQIFCLSVTLKDIALLQDFLILSVSNTTVYCYLTEYINSVCQ